MPSSSASDHTEPIATPPVSRRFARTDPGVNYTTVFIVLKSDYNPPHHSVVRSETCGSRPSSRVMSELHGLPNGGTNPAFFLPLSNREPLGTRVTGEHLEHSRHPTAGTAPRQTKYPLCARTRVPSWRADGGRGGFLGLRVDDVRCLFQFGR